MSDGLHFRRADLEDMHFVFDSWSDSYRTAHAAGPIPMHLYPQRMREYLEWIVARPGLEIHVAVHPTGRATKSDIQGWVAVEQGVKEPRRQRVNGSMRPVMVPIEFPVLHYVFVKQAYRKFGRARALLNVAGVPLAGRLVYTFKTGIVKTILDDHPEIRGSFSPLLVRYPRDAATVNRSQTPLRQKA